MTHRINFMLVLGVVFAGGCSSSGGFGGGSKVTGKVTLNGEPVAGAKVIFTDGQDTPMPSGPTATTDENGEYALVGVEPGSYKVVIYKLQPIAGMQLPEVEGEGVDLEQIEASGSGKHLLPRKYLSPSSTTLVAQVPEGSHVEDFELKK